MMQGLRSFIGMSYEEDVPMEKESGQDARTATNMEKESGQDAISRTAIKGDETLHSECIKLLKRERPSTEVENVSLPGEPHAFVRRICHALSHDTCKKLIEFACSGTFGEALINTDEGMVLAKDVRDSSRFMTDDFEISNLIYNLNIDDLSRHR